MTGKGHAVSRHCIFFYTSGSYFLIKDVFLIVSQGVEKLCLSQNVKIIAFIYLSSYYNINMNKQ